MEEVDDRFYNIISTYYQGAYMGDIVGTNTCRVSLDVNRPKMDIMWLGKTRLGHSSSTVPSDNRATICSPLLGFTQ